MNWLYKSLRIGKNEKKFWMYKLKTLRDDFDKSFADESSYTKYGHFLRKYKLDELPQFLNVLKGQMSLVGPRPEEERTINLIPEDIRKTLLSVKPGMTSLASLHFYDEEMLLKQGQDIYKDYWMGVKPLKIMLDIFYIENKSWLLDLAVLWATFKRITRLFFSRFNFGKFIRSLIQK